MDPNTSSLTTVKDGFPVPVPRSKIPSHALHVEPWMYSVLEAVEAVWSLEAADKVLSHADQHTYDDHAQGTAFELNIVACLQAVCTISIAPLPHVLRYTAITRHFHIMRPKSTHTRLL